MKNVVLGRGLLFMFALPAVAQSFLHAPAQSLLQGIYTKHAGVALAAMGFAVMLVRIWDALIDPLIGHLSDYTYPRLQSRKPWLVAGTVVTAIGLWFLFRPPAGVTVIWFAVWYLVASLGWSLIEISYRAWSIELTKDYAQRNRVQVWIALGALVGGMAFYAVPLLAKSLGFSDTTEYDLRALGLAAIVIVILMPPLNLLAVLRVGNGEMEPAPSGESWRELWRSIAGNGPLLRFLAAFAVASAGAGISTGVYYLFIDVHLGLSKQLPAITVAAVPIAMIAVPFWGWIGTRYERHKAWAVGLALTALSFAFMGFLPRGEAAFLPTLLGFVVVSACQLASYVIAPAMVGDIADYAQLEFGKDRAGIYVAFLMLMLKTIQGIAAGLGLVLVGWLGFDATATEQTEAGTFAIKFIYCWLPSLIIACAVPLIWRFPLNRARHAEIVAQIRLRRANA